MLLARLSLAAILASAVLFTPAPVASQAPDSSCVPPDTARVTAWHQRWDTASISAAAEFGDAQSGTIAMVTMAGPTADAVAPFIGRFVIRTYLLGLGVPPDTGTGMLQFQPLDHDQARAAATDDPATKDYQLLLGSLIGFHRYHSVGRYWPAGRSSDTTTMYLAASGSEAWFTDSGWLGAEDAGGFVISSWDARGFKGWWNPPGAIVPPPLGYFCARRVQ